MEVKETHQTYIKRVMMNREEFLVVGLTGRVGAGCSEAASVFKSSFSEMNLQSIFPGINSLTPQEQDRRTLYRYAKHHWLKFDVIKVRSVITSFIMENPGDFFAYVDKTLGGDVSIRDTVGHDIYRQLSSAKKRPFAKVD